MFGLGVWCNGNTWVSKTFVLGSSPSAPATGTSFERDWFFFVLMGRDSAAVRLFITQML